VAGFQPAPPCPSRDSNGIQFHQFEYRAISKTFLILLGDVGHKDEASGWPNGLGALRSLSQSSWAALVALGGKRLSKSYPGII